MKDYIVEFKTRVRVKATDKNEAIRLGWLQENLTWESTHEFISCKEVKKKDVPTS